MADIVAMPLGKDARERVEILTRLHLLGRKNSLLRRLFTIIEEMFHPLRDNPTGKWIDSPGAKPYKARS